MSGVSFDADFEDAILAQSLRDEAFLKKAAALCQSHHFSTKERSWIWGQVHSNWTQYKELTTRKILAASLRHEFAEVDKRKPYVVLAKKLFKKRPKNPKSVLAELERFVRHVTIQLAIEESAVLLEKGKVQEAEEAIVKSARSATRQRNYTHIQWIEELPERQEQRKYERDHPDQFTAIPLGFPRIDKTLGGGMRKGELGLIMGTTGRGKSVFLTNAVQSAIRHGYKAVYVALEMPARQVAARQDSRWSGFRYNQFKSFDFQPSEMRRLKNRMKKAQKQFANKLHIISMPVRSANILDVRAALEDLKDEYGFVADALFIDSLDHLRSTQQYGGNYRLQQAEVYWSGKELAEEDGYVVMSSTHAGREWAKKVATAEATAEAYDKSRIADAVMSLNDPLEMGRKGRKTIISSDDDEDDEDDDEEIGDPKVAEGARLLELYLAKYRDGDSRFKVNVESDFQRMLMREVEPEEEGDEEDDSDEQ